MAIATQPTKISNPTGTTPPPATTPPAKATLGAQFKTAATNNQSNPSTKTPPPFYTPENGSFRDTRTYFLTKYNTRLNWSVNENQQAGSNKVYIKGSLTVDWGAKNSQTYTLDGNNSYINDNGDVYYRVGGSNDAVYKTSHNVFNDIEKNVNSALRDVKNNKNYFKTPKGNVSPVSLASANLTSALLTVGELNLVRGKGLNGAGKRISETLAKELAKTDKSEDKVRVRQAIALAMNSAGANVPVARQKQADDPVDDRRLSREELSRLVINTHIEGVVNRIRRQTNTYGVEMTPREREDLYNDVRAHFANERNARVLAVVYTGELMHPGVLLPEGLNAEQREALATPIQRYILNLANFDEITRTMTAIGVQPRDQFAAYSLLVENYPLTERHLKKYIENLSKFIDANRETVSRVQNGSHINNAILDVRLGISSRQLFNYRDS